MVFIIISKTQADCSIKHLSLYICYWIVIKFDMTWSGKLLYDNLFLNILVKWKCVCKILCKEFLTINTHWTLEFSGVVFFKKFITISYSWFFVFLLSLTWSVEYITVKWKVQSFINFVAKTHCLIYCIKTVACSIVEVKP